MRVIRLVCVLVAIMWPAARSRCTLGGNPTFKEAPRVEQVSKHWCWLSLSVIVILINRLTDKVNNGKVDSHSENPMLYLERDFQYKGSLLQILRPTNFLLTIF